jgi:methyltransferase (TIGR00027 family)
VFGIRSVTATICVVLLVSSATAVEPGVPSKTSIWTASSRAIGAKNPDPEFRNPDYLAARFLGPRERALLPDYPLDALDLDFDAALKRLPSPGHVANMFLRTRHIDTALDECLRAGVRQVVILGAGFDSRGYRFADRLDGVRFIEVDYGPTQEYKKRRVKEVLGKLPNHVDYVAMDFTKDDLGEQLRSVGYSEQARTLFIWEGVVYYIPQSAVEGTLRFVKDHAAPDTRIIFDYPLSSFQAVNNREARSARWGEPIIFGFPGDSASAFVREAGLEVISDLKWYELARRYGMRPDGSSSLPMLPSADDPAGSAGKSLGICYARVPVK